MAGPTINTDAVLFESITDRVKFGERVTVVNLDSAQIPNLKSALKYINRYASNQATDLDDEETTDDGQQVRIRDFSERNSFIFERVVGI